MRLFIHRVFEVVFFIPFIIFSVFIAFIAGYFSSGKSSNAKIVWGPIPLINNKYWSKAMIRMGYKSITFMEQYSQVINNKDDFDEYYYERYSFLPAIIRRPCLFWESLFRFDVFVISFDGWLLGRTCFWRIEAHILKLANKKIITAAYGGDCYVYRNIASPVVMHGLMMSYPNGAKRQDEVEKKVRYWTKHSDCVLPGIAGIDGIGRMDAIPFSTLCLDVDQWKSERNINKSDGLSGEITISHAPNHRGFKGTEFIIDAVERLKKRGFKINLVLLEGVKNSQVKDILKNEVDILVDQLIVTGHGLNALEGMALGLPVVCNLDDPTYTTIFRRWSYLDQCPIVSATPEDIADVLEKLITNYELRKELSIAGRSYVEKYHSYEAFGNFFQCVLEYLYGERKEIINLYHPLSGEYNKPNDRVIHPLVNNRIVQ